MWSMSFIPIILEACWSFRVTISSSLLGWAIHDGWLWTMMILWDLSSIAPTNISRGCMRLWSTKPIVIILCSIRHLAPSSVRQRRYSCFLSLYSFTWSRTSWAECIDIWSGIKYRFASSKALIIWVAFTFPIPLIWERSEIEIRSFFSSITLCTFFASSKTLVQDIPVQSIAATSSHPSSICGPYFKSFSLGFIKTIW